MRQTLNLAFAFMRNLYVQPLARPAEMTFRWKFPMIVLEERNVVVVVRSQGISVAFLLSERMRLEETRQEHTRDCVSGDGKRKHTDHLGAQGGRRSNHFRS